MAKKKSISINHNKELPELTLLMPSQDLYKKAKSTLNSFRVNDLRNEAKGMVAIAKNNHIVMVDASGDAVDKQPEILNTVCTKKQPLCGIELVELCALFWAEPCNLRMYFSTLAKSLQVLWRMVTEQYYVNHKEAEKEAGESFIAKSSGYFWEDDKLKDTAEWLSACSINDIPFMQQSGYERNTYIFLNYRLRFFLNHYLTKWTPFESVVELPAALGWNTFNAESEMPVLMMLLENLEAQGVLQRGAKKVTASVVKKLQKSILPAEFFDSSTEINSGKDSLRAHLLLQMYGLYSLICQNYKDAPLHKKMRGFVDELHYYQATYTSQILFFLSGLNSTTLSKGFVCNYLGEFNAAIRFWGKQDGWLQIDEMMIEAFKLRELPLLFYINDFVGMKLKRRTDKRPLHLNDIGAMILKPLVRGYVCLLAAYGLVEVAYQTVESDDKENSPYDSFQYFRLTSLGEYAFKLKEDYLPPKSKEEDKPFFELDSENLIIRSLRDKNPYEIMLDDVAARIGATRWRVDVGSFLKKCNTQKEVDTAISRFESVVKDGLPDNWKAFIERMRNCGSGVNKVPTSYVVFQVDKENKELQKIVATDPVLKLYTQRAEDYLLLVKKIHLEIVNERFKQLGYLI